MKCVEYAEEDYLQLSGIQHFAFCRRQWALIHIEQLWAEQYLSGPLPKLYELVPCDKVGMPLRYDNTSHGVSEIIHHTDEALEALMALGYNLADASKALEGISTELSTAERVTQALRN